MNFTNLPPQDQNKDKHFKDQMKALFQCLHDRPMTMKEADIATGIMRENICWYCRTFRIQGKLFEVEKRICKVTRHRATVYTTNPELVPPSNQLPLEL